LTIITIKRQVSNIQAEINEKALRRIQKKMVGERSTLDRSQSNNISCYHSDVTR